MPTTRATTSASRTRSTTASCCRAFLAFILKFLNFLQAFLALSIIIYSAYMLNQWHHIPFFPPPSSAPSPLFSGSVSTAYQTFTVTHRVDRLNLASDVSFLGLDHNTFGFKFRSLPAPWFIFAFMGVGVVLCCVTCIGHIAAEAINGCCLCFYALLTTLLLSIEAALVAFIAVDQRWEKDLPFDPTGQLESLRNFIQGNADVCKWFGITVLIIQALSLFLAIILRAWVSTSRVDDDLEGDYNIKGRGREALLSPRLNQPFVKDDVRSSHLNTWSSRMKEKYGLNGVDIKYPAVETSA